MQTTAMQTPAMPTSSGMGVNASALNAAALQPQAMATPRPHAAILAQIYGADRIPAGAGIDPLQTWDPQRDRCRDWWCSQNQINTESLGSIGQHNIYAVEQHYAFGRPAWYLRLAHPEESGPWSAQWAQVLGQQLVLRKAQVSSEEVTIVGGDAYGVVVISDTQWDPAALERFNGGTAQGLHHFAFVYVGYNQMLDVGDDLLQVDDYYFEADSGIAGRFISNEQIKQWLSDSRLYQLTFVTQQALRMDQPIEFSSWQRHKVMASHIRFDGYVGLGSTELYMMNGIEFNAGFYSHDNASMMTLGKIEVQGPMQVTDMQLFAGQGVHVLDQMNVMGPLRLVNRFVGETLRLPSIAIEVDQQLHIGPYGQIRYNQGGSSDERYDEAARLGNPYWPQSVGRGSIWECDRMSGGGALRIKARALLNEGRVSVDGDVQDRDIHSCWAGSGGSLIVQTERLSGNGDFTSLGDTNGRMAIYAQQNQFTGSYRAATAYVAANPQQIGVLHMNAELNSAENMEWPHIPMQQIAYIQPLGHNEAEEALWQLGVSAGAHAQWPQLAGGQGTSLVGSYLTTNWQDATPTYARVVEQHSDSLVVALPVGIDLSDWAGKTMISAHRFNSVQMPSNQQEWRQLDFGHARLDILHPEQSEIKANEVRSGYIEAGLAQWFASQGITWRDGTQPRW